MDAIKRFVSASVAYDFGENVAAVAGALVVLGQADTALLSRETGLDRPTLRRCLLVLVKHDLVIVNEKISKRTKPGMQIGPSALDDDDDGESSDDDDQVACTTELSKKKQAGATRVATRRAVSRRRLLRPVYSLNGAVLDMRACFSWYAGYVRRVLGEHEATVLRLLAQHGRLTPRDLCEVYEKQLDAARAAREAVAEAPAETEAEAGADAEAEAEAGAEAGAAAPAPQQLSPEQEEQEQRRKEEAEAERQAAAKAEEEEEALAEATADEVERALLRLYRLRFVKRVDPLGFVWEGGAGYEDAPGAHNKRKRAGGRVMLDEGNADMYMSVDYGRALAELRNDLVVEYVAAGYGQDCALIIRAMLSRHPRNERRLGTPELGTEVVAALVRMSEGELVEAALRDEQAIAADEERLRRDEEEAGAMAVDEDEEVEDEGADGAVPYGLPGAPRLPTEGKVMRYERIHRLAGRMFSGDNPVLERTKEDGGGVIYAVVTKHALDRCCDAFVRSSLKHQFGSIGAVRIYNVLRVHGKLEEKQVHDMATVDKKVGREIMYAMQQAGYLRMQEVPTTADRNPGKTIFLWEVQPGMSEHTYTQQLAVTWSNLRERLERERSQVADLLRLETRRGLDKRQRQRYEKWAARRNRLAVSMSGVARLLVLFRHLDHNA